MSDKTVYFTTPIYYPNAKPHIGHAYTTILCDAYSRYYRFIGKDVFFLTGTDEHGEKILKAADEKGVSVMDHLNEVVPRFVDLWKALDIQYDDFIRTTEDRHKEVAQKLVAKLYEEGAIYQVKYKGWYCTPCETFWTAQLDAGKCPECRREVKELEEENYFFKMSDYQGWLKKYIQDNPGFIYPKSKEKEVLSFLKEPLEDLCITRPKERLSWGIPLPFDENHVLYVWFDALINYLSAIGCQTDEKRFETFWPARIHFMAKDILRHHGVYWPTMLKAMGLEQPGCILAHGFWTMEGSKMSKSVGNIADPYDIINLYGSDALRYFLLKEVTLGADGAYADEYVIARFNTDLANDLGNLVHRSFSMLEKYCDGELPAENSSSDFSAIQKIATALGENIAEAIEKKLDPRTALTAIWELVSATNKLVEDIKPWTLAKDAAKRDELENFLYTLFEAIRFIGVALKPFLPETSRKILTLLQIDFQKASAKDLDKWGGLAAGKKLEKGEPLFPKVDV